MHLRLCLIICCWLVLPSLGHTSATPPPPNRIALVIGNNIYADGLAPLENAGNDADAVAKMLEKELCFDRVLRARDANRREMLGVLHEFESALSAGDIAFVYYSGHGAQFSGQDALIPVDFNRQRAIVPDAAIQEVIRVTDVLDTVARAKAGVSIVLLDTNFLSSVPSMSRSLIRVESGTPSGALIMYAAQPGAAAMDSFDGSAQGPFAAALLEHLPKTTVGLLDSFNNVTLSVNRMTEGGQTPYMQFHLLPPIRLKGDDCPRAVKSQDDKTSESAVKR